MSRTRHPLKAYLSDNNLRAESNARILRAHRASEFEGAAIGLSAVAELERILAETEPMRPGYLMADRCYLGPISMDPLPLPGDAGIALAESLACLMAAPDFAEELRFNQIEDGTKAGALAYCAAIKAAGGRQ